MHNGIIREGTDERYRKREAGEYVFWQRLSHYAKFKGGSFKKTDIICSICRSHVKTFCDQSGFKHDPKNPKTHKPHSKAAVQTPLEFPTTSGRVLRNKRISNSVSNEELEGSHCREIHHPRQYSPPRENSPARESSPPRENSPPREISPHRENSPARESSPPRDNSPPREVSPLRKNSPPREMSPSDGPTKSLHRISAEPNGKPPFLTCEASKPPGPVCKPPSLIAKPTVLTCKPPVLISKPTVLTCKPPDPTCKPPVLISKPTVLTLKPPALIAKPTVLKMKLPTLIRKPESQSLLASTPPSIQQSLLEFQTNLQSLSDFADTLIEDTVYNSEHNSLAEEPRTSEIEGFNTIGNDNLNSQEIIFETGNEQSVSIAHSEELTRNHAQATYSQSTCSELGDSVASKRRRTTEDLTLSKKRSKNEIMSVGYTESKCFICGKYERKAVPSAAIFKLCMHTRVFIPKKNRTCAEHLNDRKCFTEEAVNLILQKSRRATNTSVEDLTTLVNKITDSINEEEGPLINMTTATDDDCRTFFGIGRYDFDTLFCYIKQHLHKSSLRTGETALAIFLTKLRLGVSQTVLAKLFGVKNQSNVSKVIHRVAKLLETHFVPLYLGFDHMKREDISNVHNPDFVNRIFGVGNDNIVLILDGTYVYIEQSSNQELQSSTYSPHKHRHLVKFMMVTTPDGYIIDAPGPFLADAANSDAKILSNLLKKEGDGIAAFLQKNDHLILDRGFRDVLALLEKLGIKFSMPEFLNKDQRSFTTEQANLSRRVTMCRWSVESANGRLKNKYQFWDNVVPLPYLPIVNSLFRISCALINRFSPVPLTETLHHQRLVDQVELKVHAANELKQKVEDFELDNRRDWDKIPAVDLEGFTQLTMDDLYEITCGVYQVKNVGRYNERILQKNPQYEIFKHKRFNGIIKVQIPSRYRRGMTHTLWIEFEPQGAGLGSVTGYYCHCQIGSRVLGCCSHICAVLFHLGIGRFQPVPVKKNFISCLLDAAERYSKEASQEEEIQDNVIDLIQ